MGTYENIVNAKGILQIASSAIIAWFTTLYFKHRAVAGGEK